MNGIIEPFANTIVQQTSLSCHDETDNHDKTTVIHFLWELNIYLYNSIQKKVAQSLQHGCRTFYEPNHSKTSGVKFTPEKNYFMTVCENTGVGSIVSL